MSDGKTIFEGLYQIDWANINHFYESNVPYRIPHTIRDLLSNDANIRDDARNFLFGDEPDGDRGRIADATVHIVRFSIEILNLSEAPDRAELVSCLARIVNERSYASPFEDEGLNPLDVYELRRFIAIYELLEKHVPLFLKLLETSDQDLRTCTAALLGEFSAQQAILVPCLIDQFEREAHVSVQHSILEALGGLFTTRFHNSETIKLRDHTVSFLWRSALNHPAKRIAYSAAQIGVKILFYRSGDQSTPQNVPPHVVSLLLEALRLNRADEYSGYLRTEILQQIMRLPNAAEALITLVKEENLMVPEVHQIAKSLLCYAFVSPDEYYKFDYSYYTTSDGRYIYHRMGLFWPDYLKVGRLRAVQKIAIKTILESDVFWKIPTNLFSYFFGLPDTRDELRAFLDNNKDQS